MLGTYVSVVAVCASSLAIGQATLLLCGRRQWSWGAPAVGLALVLALCWATVRLPGDGILSAVAVLGVTLAALIFLRGRLEGLGDALRDGAPVGIVALLAASIPFVVEGHFGILGTSFNPDMSQHLLAADRLAGGDSSQLLVQGYPLGPHAVVVALNKGLGVGLVQGFSGFTVAVAVLAALTAIGALGRLARWRRWIGALLIGGAYMLVSYFAQGAFKETTEGLFILAFAIELWRLESGEDQAAGGVLRCVPLGLLGAGAVYAYSFPGLTWLAGALVIWALTEAVFGRRRGIPRSFEEARPWLYGGLVFLVLVAPEIGRMLDFRRFETFDPNGPGLGNLFGQISPFESLGIWPSGDFRLTPGAGAVPAIAFHAGAALALALLAYGLYRQLRRREFAFGAALAAALLAYAAARLGGTPYTASKAIAMISPVAALIIVRELLDFEPTRLVAPGREPFFSHSEKKESHEGSAEPSGPVGALQPLAAALFIAAAGVCSLLALANAPVGPTSYSSSLTALRSTFLQSPTLVLAPEQFLGDDHGTPYIAWELRGGRVCIRAARGAGEGTAPKGIRWVVSVDGEGGAQPFNHLKPVEARDGYRVWRVTGPSATGPGPCPLIAVRQARQGPAPTG